MYHIMTREKFSRILTATSRRWMETWGPEVVPFQSSYEVVTGSEPDFTNNAKIKDWRRELLDALLQHHSSRKHKRVVNTGTPEDLVSRSSWFNHPSDLVANTSAHFWTEEEKRKKRKLLICWSIMLLWNTSNLYGHWILYDSCISIHKLNQTVESWKNLLFQNNFLCIYIYTMVGKNQRFWLLLVVPIPIDLLFKDWNQRFHFI